MNTRRQILKLLGMAPAAATSATTELLAAVSSPAIFAASTASLGAQGGLPQPDYGKLGAILGKQIQRLRNKHEAEIWSYRNARLDGLDPDIAALKSCSRSYKVRKQIDRERDASDLVERVNELMWG